MISNTPENNPSSIYLKLSFYFLLSGLWYGLAVILGEIHPATRLGYAVVILGGFLPAAAGLLMMKRIRRKRERSTNLSLAWFVLTGIYPLFISGWLITSFLIRLPAGLTAWIEHPIFLTLNLMAVLLVGPIAEITGLKDCLISRMKKDSTNQMGKWVVVFFWWLWHIPFLFVNGTALARFNLSDFMLGVYLLGILGLSFFLTWGYNQKRRQVLLTAIRHY
jgi:hypothetical protein